MFWRRQCQCSPVYYFAVVVDEVVLGDMEVKGERKAPCKDDVVAVV